MKKVWLCFNFRIYFDLFVIRHLAYKCFVPFWNAKGGGWEAG